MPFQEGNKYGKGPPKKLQTQVKDWIKEHPFAVAALMQVLYEKGISGDRECAMYVIDRIKGKPKAITGLDDDTKDLVTAALVLEFRSLIDTKVIDIGYKELEEG